MTNLTLKRILPPVVSTWLSDAKLTRVSQRPEAVEVGDTMVKSMIDLIHLKPDDHVLDVGCGYGRIALPLTRYLSAAGRYEGFDILPGEIRWAQRHITPKYPNFHFQLANIHNKYYNIAGTITAREFVFPFADSTFDVVCLHSVFTHLLRKDLEHYLSEIARVMKPGARAHITYFLLNDRPGRRERYPYEDDGCRLIDQERPEWEVAYEEAYIRELYQKNGLRILEPVQYGFQDIVAAVKEH